MRGEIFNSAAINTTEDNPPVIAETATIPGAPGRTVATDTRGAIGENLRAEIAWPIAENQRADATGIRATRESYGTQRQHRQ